MQALTDIFKIIRAVVQSFWYWLWLVVVGNRVESGLKLLSESIIANRSMLNELKAQQRILEMRVWKLEEHTPEETLQKVSADVEAWVKRVDQLKRRAGDGNHSAEECDSGVAGDTDDGGGEAAAGDDAEPELRPCGRADSVQGDPQPPV